MADAVHVEETPKGFAIAWINRDPEVLARQAARERKEHSELSDAERMDRFLQQQIEAARKVEEEKGDSAHRTVYSSIPPPPSACPAITNCLMCLSVCLCVCVYCAHNRRRQS